MWRASAGWSASTRRRPWRGCGRCEIVAHLARQLDAAWTAVEARRVASAAEHDALDLYFQGMTLVHRGYARENLDQAADFFGRALRLDLDHVDSLVGAAWVEMTLAGAYTTDDRGARYDAARKALALAPDNAAAHLALARLEIFSRRGGVAIIECERALALDLQPRRRPCNHWAGEDQHRPQRRGGGACARGLAAQPARPQARSWLATTGAAALYLGRDEHAVLWVRRSRELYPDAPNAHFYLAAALAHLGRHDEARAAVAQGLAVNPTYTISRFRESPFGDDPRFLRQRERIYDGLRKAGAPDA